MSHINIAITMKQNIAKTMKQNIAITIKHTVRAAPLAVGDVPQARGGH